MVTNYDDTQESELKDMSIRREESIDFDMVNRTPASKDYLQVINQSSSLDDSIYNSSNGKLLNNIGHDG